MCTLWYTHFGAHTLVHTLWNADFGTHTLEHTQKALTMCTKDEWIRLDGLGWIHMEGYTWRDSPGMNRIMNYSELIKKCRYREVNHMNAIKIVCAAAPQASYQCHMTCPSMSHDFT